MSSQLKAHTKSISSAFFVLLTLGCSLLSQLPGQQETVSLPSTRTPLPTFTLTAVANIQQPISPVSSPVSIPPTSTLAPLPTETPVPEPTATETPIPEPTATETPVPAPTDPPPPPPAAPPPTDPPLPPSEPGVGAHGIIGKIEFRDGRNTYGVGEKVFVRIEAKTPNETGQIPFGILGLNTSTGTFQTSWSSGTIDGKFTHEDGIPFPSPGTHKMWLSICFSTIEVCQGANGDWERFEPGLDVIIQ